MPLHLVGRSWPMLASIGINGALIAVLLSFPTETSEDDEGAPDFIRVELVELPPELAEAEPEIISEDEAPVEAGEPAPPAPGPAPVPQAAPRTAVQSPVIARPDEAVEADAMTGTDASDAPAVDLPVFAPPAARAETALQALACARLGRERPAWCDEAADGDVIEVAAGPSFAGTPQIAPKEWAALDVQVREEWCPEADGVIKDVVVENDSPFLQGAAAMAGSLASSAATSC
ncbi:MAG TPA: hypothetical protein EYG02_00240 [Henriciella marina]|uniref:hypothetical protein n=1 Tax=Henriciella sp. TaxID=1968823 RepID=UPI0018074B5B|nr:hypothetical protein [Henriciella sp.]HIG23752.1 hypothetical protein [Henriciella sp.]HIK63439.1 hypothetical protein [Henriciella marina]